MTRFGSNIVERLSSEDDRKAGLAFLQASDLPFPKDLAHHALLDGAKDFVRRAHLSYGHRAATNTPGARFAASKLTAPEFIATHGPDFTKWNETTAVGAARWNVLDKQAVGAILCVGRHGPTGPRFITIVGSPVITPVLEDRIDNYGAPILKGVADPDVLTPAMVPGFVQSAHFVVASLAGLGNDPIPTDLPELVEQTKPVIMGVSDRFHARLSASPDADDDDEEGPFKCLFLPKYCDPAVGLFWPVDIGYEKFCALIEGKKPYSALYRLFNEKRSVVKPWFDNAALRSAEMVIQMTQASPFWEAMHTTSPACAPFLRQMSMFLWRQFCHKVLSAKASSAEEEAAIADFLAYIQAVDGCHLDNFPDQHLAAVDRPFVVQVYSMTSRPALYSLLKPFLGWIDAGLVPKEIADFKCYDLPNSVSTQTAGVNAASLPTHHDGGQSHLVTQLSQGDSSVQDEDYLSQKPAAREYPVDQQGQYSRVTDDRSTHFRGYSATQAWQTSSLPAAGVSAAPPPFPYTPAESLPRRLHFDMETTAPLGAGLGDKRDFTRAHGSYATQHDYGDPSAFESSQKRPRVSNFQRATLAATNTPQTATVYGGFLNK